MFDMVSSIFKNLFSKPATRAYPFERRATFHNTRGQISGIDIDKCIFCGMCERKCPALALKVNRAEKSWEINPYKCVICGICTEVCPKKCIIMDEAHRTAVEKKSLEKHVQETKPVVEKPEEKSDVTV